MTRLNSINVQVGVPAPVQNVLALLDPALADVTTSLGAVVVPVGKVMLLLPNGIFEKEYKPVASVVAIVLVRFPGPAAPPG